MMSLKVLHAGDGYQYLTKQVATGDHPRTRGELMADYYTAHGMPAGQWWGKGAEALGVSGEVTEEQMQASYGEFLHPDANEKLRSLLANGATAEDALKQVRLGRKPMDFNRQIPFMVAVKEQTIEFTQVHRRVPTPEEKETIEQVVARRMLSGMPPTPPNVAPVVTETSLGYETLAEGVDDLGSAVEMSLSAESLAEGKTQPLTPNRVKQFIAQEKSRARYPVAGYDLVFTPAKSISILWGIGDEHTRKAIMRAHSEAVEASLKWIEDNALFTRAGEQGTKKIDCDGAVIAKYVHWDNRAGDPNLHTHCPVLNRVPSVGKDGETVWRTIDGTVLHRAAVTASEHYNQQVTQLVSKYLPVTFTAVEKQRDARPVWEINGIPDELMHKMSRRDEVLTRGRELIAEYKRKYGRSPSKATQHKLMEQANLETRDAKGEARSLEEMVTDWRKIADSVSEDFSLDSVLTDVFTEPEWLEKPPADAPDEVKRAYNEQEAKRRHEYDPKDRALIVKRVMHRVARDRPTWTEYQLGSEISRQLAAYIFADDTERQNVADSLLTECLNGHCVTVDRHREVPEALTRRNGESVYVAHASVRYTSDLVLAAEDTVSDATNIWLANGHGPSELDRLVAEFAEKNGYQLSSDKREFIEHLLCSPAALAAGVGAAGSGKTTAMQIFARAWESTGNKVIGLAPSATAAQVLGESLGINTGTIASFNHTGSSFPDQPIERGDVILIDEAGMASTLDLAEVVKEASARGAFVRMVGDPQQLASIESGGMLGAVAESTDAPILSEIHRFRNEDEADVTLKLRSGDSSVIDWYQRHGRISSGLREQLPAEVFEAWLASKATGKTALMIAGDSGSVDTLNEMARLHYIDTGDVRPQDGQVDISDHRVAAVGDTIVTRRNESRIRYGHRGKHRVKNGDLWTVKAVSEDGELVVSHADSGHVVTLPADYVREDVQLGYSSTIYRSQGQTVDHAFVLPSAALDRQGLYVAMTRGREVNRLFVPDDQVPDLDSHIDQAQAMTPREFLESIIARDGSAVTAHAALSAAADNFDFTTALLAYNDLVEDMVTEVVIAAAGDETTAELLRDDWQTPRLATAVTRLDHAGVDTDKALRTAITAAKARWDKADDEARGSLAFLVRMELENLDKSKELADDDLLWALGTPMPPHRDSDSRSRVLPDEELYDYVCSTYAVLQEHVDAAGDRAIAEGAPWIEQIGERRPDDLEYNAVWENAVRTVAAVAQNPAVDLSDLTAIDSPEIQHRLEAVAAANRRRRDPFEGLTEAQLRSYMRKCDQAMEQINMTAVIENEALRQAEAFPETTRTQGEWELAVEQAAQITAHREAHQALEDARAEYQAAMDEYTAALNSPRIGRGKRVDAAQARQEVAQDAMRAARIAESGADHGLPPRNKWDEIVALAGNTAEWEARMTHAKRVDTRAVDSARSKVDRREAELHLWGERKSTAEALADYQRQTDPELSRKYLQRWMDEFAARRAARVAETPALRRETPGAAPTAPPATPSDEKPDESPAPRRSRKRQGGWRAVAAKHASRDALYGTPVSTAVPEQSVESVVAGVLQELDMETDGFSAATTPRSAREDAPQQTGPEEVSEPTTPHQEGPAL